jgi:hypothetical protein
LRAYHEEALDCIKKLLRLRVPNSDWRWTDAVADWVVGQYNILLTGNTDRRSPSAVTVNHVSRGAARAVLPKVVADRCVLQKLVTGPMLDLGLHGLDLDEEQTHSLVSETMRLVGRESPHVTEDDRTFLKTTMLGIRRWEGLRADRAISMKTTKEWGKMLMHLSLLKPDWERPGSWGVWSFAAKATTYFVYERMRAAPRLWKRWKGAEWCRVLRAKTRRPVLDGYRLCAFADYLIRNRWRIEASAYRPNLHRTCDGPIMTGDDAREAWCSDACRKNLTSWRQRLRAGKSP